MRDNGVAAENLGKDLKDGSKLTQLMKTIDDDNFGSSDSHNSLLDKLA